MSIIAVLVRELIDNLFKREPFALRSLKHAETAIRAIGYQRTVYSHEIGAHNPFKLILLTCCVFSVILHPVDYLLGFKRRTYLLR